MATCCEAPSPIILGDGRWWCRHCRQYINEPQPRGSTSMTASIQRWPEIEESRSAANVAYRTFLTTAGHEDRILAGVRSRLAERIAEHRRQYRGAMSMAEHSHDRLFAGMWQGRADGHKRAIESLRMLAKELRP